MSQVAIENSKDRSFNETEFVELVERTCNFVAIKPSK